MTAELRARRRADYGFTLEYRTRWTDNDMYGHMNNAVYYFLFDSAVNAYLIQSGSLPPDPSGATEIGVVAHSHCDYFRSVRFPAVADVCVRANSVGRTSVRYEIGVFEHGTDEPCAVGEFVHVFVDRATMKPRRDGMGPKLRAELEKLLPSGRRAGQERPKAKL